MNCRGGQPQVMEIAARDIHRKYQDFSVFSLLVWRVPNVAAELFSPRRKNIATTRNRFFLGSVRPGLLLSAKELEFGIHAGDAATSLMLSILPSQVKMELAVTEYPKNLPIDSLLSMEGNLPFAWLTQDLTESGVLGDATAAAKEKGDRILESI